MSQWNIALVLSASLQKTLFTEKAVNQLRKLGNVTLNPVDELTADQLVELAHDADIVITSWGAPVFSADVMARLPRLKYVAHAAGSVKSFVTDELYAQGVKVTSSAKVLGKGVAETALGLTIASVKNFFNVSRGIASGGWTGETPLKEYDDIRELFEITVGCIGAGMAGSHYLKLMNMFDVDLLLYDPFVSEEDAREKYNARKVSLEELLSKSDVVSIHAPSIPETHHMFNAETLKLMKKDASIVNTARGTLIDETALYEHMKAGNLKYACLDVFDPEPPKADNPLRELPNVIMTPHLAGLTHNGLLRIGQHCADEVARFIAGEPLTTEVTQEQLANMA